MDWTVDRGDGFLVVRTRGPFAVDDHRRMIEDFVSRDFWTPGANVLFDHRDLDFSESGVEEMRAAQENHRAYDDRIGAGRAALVMRSAADFGIGRQFELLTEARVQANLRVFRDEHEAAAWLRDGHAA